MEQVMAIVKGEQVVDYAYPTMKAEKALKALHDAALEKDWNEALQQALVTIKWATEAHAALKVMQQNDN
jgi:hypothetical protein